jgi:prepilin-type N-terminal cleavage/methylation domain-containing protein/prepilin-type processing-associated H-X9-DG protein
MNKFGQKKKGFTLVELLVVIGIIAVLMGVLMPCLAQARQQGRRAVCASNIRQLFLANSGYAIENNGFYVLAAEDIWSSSNLRRWHGVRKSKNKAFDPLKGPLKSYLADGEVKRCPAFREIDYLTIAGQNSQNFEAGCGGYGYNDEYIGGRSDRYGMGEGSKHSAKNYDVRNSADTVMFADAAFRQRVNNKTDVFIEYSFVHPPYWVWYLQMMGNVSDDELAANAESWGGRPNPTIHFRHCGFANVCWSDGHVTKETMDLSSPYITHAVMPEGDTAAMALGWFGPDNNTLFDLE